MTPLTNDSDKDWERFGQTDPYYAVLSEERFRRDQLTSDGLTEFFRSGREHVERVLAIIRERLDPAFRPMHALDFGCGVGRVLVPLAECCEAVTGLDISEAMLAEARRNCECAGMANVQLGLADDDVSAAVGAYDLVHCYIVLQHVPVPRGERIIRALVKRLAPRGVAVLHVTYMHEVPRSRRLLYWARTRVPFGNALLNVSLGRSPSAPMMQGNDYSITRLLDSVHELGCGEVHVRFTNHQGNRGVLLFCRKEATPVFT
ncbi:MAG: class I SAM-dependent methyltransferase [Gemmatimonadaceae bacterium]